MLSAAGRRLQGQRRPDLIAICRIAQSKCELQRAREGPAMRMAAEATRIARRLADPTLKGRAYAHFAAMLSRFERPRRAERAVRRSLRWYRRAGLLDELHLPHSALAALRLQQGDLSGARRLFLAVIASRERWPGGCGRSRPLEGAGFDFRARLR